MIPQMEPWFGDEEADAVHAYMKSGAWVTEFKKTREFEQMIADYTGAKYCSIMPNGTISLICALLACDVGPGDEVIVPDFTMVATPNAVEIINAHAVFVDVEPENGCMDFEKMTAAVTERTKAVMLVPINGRYPNMERFVEFCKEKNIWLIEDAAQALGSRYKGKHLGTFGIIGSFSFSMPKIISTGQGGALITDDKEIYEKITKLRDFGREGGGTDHYLVKGWNFKSTDLQSVLGIEQMKKLPARVTRKKEIAQLYDSLLKDIPQVSLLQTNYEDTVPWFIDIYVEKRDALKKFLVEKGFGAREMYPALHSCPAYDRKGSFPAAENIARTGLWLPSATQLTDEQVKNVCAAIKQFYEVKDA